ncbi:transcript variant X2 [Nothobranchius furzeri]|uniref:Transcript variant X2 n=1 Tax=Nothobranchius furzeri TaxID=105023 RepID=A0A9D3B938_NOTFU|nr:transcript variant X2 [Nothobranchius furzeri]
MNTVQKRASETSSQSDLLPFHRSNSSMIHQVRKGPGRPRIKDKYDGLELRVRLLEDPKMEGLSNKVFKKAPVQDLKCPCGLQESDFLDHLRSSFPQLANGEPFDIFKTNRNRKLLPLRVKALTPEEIHETVNWPSRCGQLLTLYLRLKNGEQNNLNKEGELCDFPAMVEPPSAEPVHLQNNEAEIHQRLVNYTHLYKMFVNIFLSQHFRMEQRGLNRMKVLAWPAVPVLP